MLVVIHQSFLSTTKLTEIILSSERNIGNLFSANKEGIASLPGYVSLHLLAEWVSKNIIFNKKVKDGGSKDLSTMNILSRLGLLTGICFGIWYFLSTTIQKTSRRLMNSAYFFLVMWISLDALLLSYLVDVNIASFLSARTNISNGIIQKSFSIAVYEVLNKHSLLVFLGANIMTGLINQTVQTLYTPTEMAMTIIIIYNMFFIILAFVLDHYKPLG